MRRFLCIHLIAFATGCLLDLIIGDPYSLPHPVKAMGSLISALEKRLNKADAADEDKRAAYLKRRGTLLVITVLLATLLISAAVCIGAYLINIYAGMAVEAILTCYVLAGRCLYNESMKVCRDLKKDDIKKARYDLSMIVGRDTDKLEKPAIIRAAVETVAENASDGCIAPFIYTFIGGPVAGLLYKAVNTMDSMIAYHNERYEYFGKTAAAADDVLNYLPSRLSALLFICAAFLLPGYSAKDACRIWKRDRRKHLSPNSAQTESTCAGALGIQLGGVSYYKGVAVERPRIGDDKREVSVDDIPRANVLMFAAAGILMAILYIPLLICLL